MAAQQTKEKTNLLLKQSKDVAVRLFEVFENNRDRSNLILRSVRGEYERNRIDLAPLLTSSVNKFRMQAEDKKIQVDLTLQVPSLHISGNSLDFSRVMDNLLGNALRHVPNGASIAISAGFSGNDVIVDVTDTGEGIQPDQLDKIWEMGWQTGDKKGSAGLGLSIVKQIIDMHQGKIRAISDGLGKGTTFRIELPLVN